MAKSKYEYVREFETATDYRLLRDSHVILRVDGQGFHRFSKDHSFLKPNDKRCLDLMNKSALHVMRSFYPNIVMAYGQSDEFSFVLRRFTKIFNRRQNKLTSLIASQFTSAFVFYWNNYFDLSLNRKLSLVSNQSESLLNQSLKYPPAFDGRCVIYPNETTLKDYLRWRQVDCHINNLYNTTFYALTGEYCRYRKLDDKDDRYSIECPYRHNDSNRFCSNSEATEKLSGSSSGDKNEILFTDHGINYNNELEQFKKGTTIVVKLDRYQEEMRKKEFKSEGKHIKIKSDKHNEHTKNNELSEYDLFEILHIDIVSENFWQNYGDLLKY
ncbi:alanyl-tRNA synthetase domain containing 1 [Sarcoptes scabiei]|nr:alanyl-tRNA synthetase domain containing 1 [Sarcoptes scabiei]